jgi:hypothetical protein
MPRDAAIIFGDLIGKLDVLRVECPKCGRGPAPVADLLRAIRPRREARHLGTAQELMVGSIRENSASMDQQSFNFREVPRSAAIAEFN